MESQAPPTEKTSLDLGRPDVGIATIDSGRLERKGPKVASYEKVISVSKGGIPTGGRRPAPVKPRHRKETWRVVLGFFSVTLVVVTIGVIVGIYLLIQDRVKSRAAAETQSDYRTIGSLCRHDHDHGAWHRCIFEMNQTGQCQGILCQKITWKLTVDKEKGTASFEQSSTNVSVIGVEHAHCAQKKQCVSRKCESRNEEPWSNAIKFKEGRWIEDRQSACFAFGDSEAALEKWQELRQLEDCTDMCGKDNVVEKSFRVAVQRCETESETEAVYRHLPCDGHPLKIYPCNPPCPNFNANAETPEEKSFEQTCTSKPVEKQLNGGCLWKCNQPPNYHVRANGVPCKTPKGKSGYCLFGMCYELST